MSTSTLEDAAPTGSNMIQLAEILQRSAKLRQRRFEMLPLRGPGAAFSEPQGRKPGDATAPEELSDLISSMSVVGMLEPVLAEEITVADRAPTIRLVTGERLLRAMRWVPHTCPTTRTSPRCLRWSAPVPSATKSATCGGSSRTSRANRCVPGNRRPR